MSERPDEKLRLSGSVNLRPTRIGFLVSPNDLRSIRKIIRLNAVLWGGQFNPIIPVLKRAPNRWLQSYQKASALDVTRGLIRFFEPDVIVEANPGLASKIGWSAGESYEREKRLIDMNAFFSIDHYSRAQPAAGISLSDVYANLYQKEFRFEQKNRIDCAIPDKNSKEDVFLDAVMGNFPVEKHLEFFGKNFRSAFAPIEVPSSAETLKSILEGQLITPLWFTRHGLKRDYDSSHGPTVFVFDPADAQDVIDFWNYRILERWVFPINLNWFEDCLDWIQAFIAANFRPLEGNPNGVMTHTTLEFARSINEIRRKELSSAVAAGVPSGSFFVKTYYDSIWQYRADDTHFRVGRPVRVSGAKTSFDEKVAVNESFRGVDLTIRVPKLAPSFLGSANSFEKSTWANVVTIIKYGRADSIATVYPINFLNPRIPNLRWGEFSPITREGWVLPQDFDTSHDMLHLEFGRSAIIGWLKLRDIEANPSDAGRIAEQIIAAVEGLQSCAMLADPSVIKLLNEMASGGDDSGVPTQRWENIFKKTDRGRMPWITLQRFIDAQILRSGLQIKCPNCSKLNWYDVKTLDYDLICHRCLKAYKFPQDAAHLNGLRWLYRAIGPFAVPGFAGGGYCVALTLRFFGHALEIDCSLTWTTGLDLKINGKSSEIDFAFWYLRRRHFGEYGEPALMIGEAKSFAENAVTKADIDRIVELAEKLPGAFLVFAVLKEHLTTRETTLLRKLASWGRRRQFEGRPRNPLIVLTGKELFTTYRISRDWQSNPKVKALVGSNADLANPLTLAEITQRLHLNMHPFHADFERRLQTLQLRKQLRAKATS
ncbi:hypothetical protein V1290_004679 [Bradyrhizobium sp. AZCC 1578]|uniref:hypothetical protein n=1 Tax=Bradyrhizobium sp. AZCC 1578 TaxID=3117027 RepID=UPI002FF37828